MPPRLDFLQSSSSFLLVLFSFRLLSSRYVSLSHSTDSLLSLNCTTNITNQQTESQNKICPKNTAQIMCKTCTFDAMPRIRLCGKAAPRRHFYSKTALRQDAQPTQRPHAPTDCQRRATQQKHRRSPLGRPKNADGPTPPTDIFRLRRDSARFH